MDQGVPLFPEAASTMAGKVDALYFFLVAVAVFFAALIFISLTVFALKYRRRSETEVPPSIHGSTPLEIAWSVIPLGLVMIMFAWGAKLYFDEYNEVPPDAEEVYVVGKQWMWHIQHANGRREINELHVPVGRPIKLIMASEDVIHSFYIPAFRLKKDVVPGRYATIWFQATKPGRYHLFCAEYCGTGHSKMKGWVTVMEPAEYQAWLSGGVVGESMEAAGERLFNQLGCNTCHRADGTGRGPSLVGVFGKPVRLLSGETVIADEAYIRESILNPNAKIVAGYPSPTIMSTYQGQISERGILQIIAYLKSLSKEERSQ